MINSRFYKTLIKTSPKLSNEQLNYKKYYNNVEENKIKEGKQCPYCKGEKIIKFGFFNGHQRFRCKNELCKKTFTASINNPFRYSKKFRKNYEKYFEFFIQGLPLRICAAKTGITLVTAFFWRHRFLHDLARKNYKEKITQREIYTTEKYLYKKALRSVAIIVSREGASRNALLAAKGCLRENGKLILCLSDKDLNELIHIKEKGEQPTAEFFEAMLDDILIHLEK